MMLRIRLSSALLVLPFITAFFLFGCSTEEDGVKPERDTTPPTVVDHFPDDEATNVTRSGPFWILFSEAMDEDDIVDHLWEHIDFTPYVGVQGAFVGDTLHLTPYAQLAANTEYTVDVFDCKDAAGNGMAGDYTFRFTTTSAVDDTPPTIVGTDPENDASGVSPGQPVTIVFSEPMDITSTMNAITFTPTTDIIDEEWVGTGVTLWHPPFPTDSDIEVTVGTGAQDLAGNNLAASYRFSFHTLIDDTRPYLVSASPANGATGVSRNLSQMAFDFSEPLFPMFEMPPENISAVIMRHVAGEPDWNADFSSLTVPITDRLPGGCTFWVDFEDVTDLAGNPIDPNPTHYEFTTTGDLQYFNYESGVIWFTNPAEDDFEGRYIENYDSRTGYFDVEERDSLDLIHDIWHMRHSGSEIQHLGVDLYDHEGNYEGTMEWDEPLPYIKLPMENYLGQSWSKTTGVTFGAVTGTIEAEMVVEAFTDDIVVSYDYHWLTGTFNDCIVHHLYITITGGQEPMEVHQKVWFSPCLGWVKIINEESGHDPDTMTVYGWEY